MTKKIAIIGAGISGLSGAYFLKDTHDVTVYEKNDRIGGHSRTITIEKNIDVDTGFIVLNDRTYPHLNTLFKDLKIELTKTEMTFSISANQGELEWSGTSIDTLFAQRKNIFNPFMIRGVWDILKFNKNAVQFVKNFPNLSLRDLMKEMNLSSWFQEYYILPMGGAIWSCPYEKMMDFPASTFVTFFQNHGLLSIHNRPQWYTLKNKSIDYVQTLEDSISQTAQILKNSSIDYIKRTENGVEIKRTHTNDIDTYDEVLFACHPKEILTILKDPTEKEKNILEKFSNQKNKVYTHKDPHQMPKLKKCWSSWNYLYDKKNNEGNVAVTYWMNKLQHIDASFPVFVTLNPTTPIPEEKIYDVCDFDHPIFDQKSLIGQKELDSIQGENKTWFCGAYLRYGFHEDGIWSTVNVLEKMSQKKYDQ